MGLTLSAFSEYFVLGRLQCWNGGYGGLAWAKEEPFLLLCEWLSQREHRFLVVVCYFVVVG